VPAQIVARSRTVSRWSFTQHAQGECVVQFAAAIHGETERPSVFTATRHKTGPASLSVSLIHLLGGVQTLCGPAASRDHSGRLCFVCLVERHIAKVFLAQ